MQYTEYIHDFAASVSIGYYIQPTEYIQEFDDFMYFGYVDPTEQLNHYSATGNHIQYTEYI